MGVSIHYRGTLGDLDRLEDLEDRVIDLSLELGGNAQIWRTADDADPSRMVRGLILDLAPGQESTSLLFSPEGFLVGFMEIEASEQGPLPEKPWCSVKTQYGSLEGHVALVHLLAAIKSHFIPDLEVTDESGYWEHRDFDKLRQSFSYVGNAIKALGTALEQDRLSPEAAEDPEILATRIERLAGLVHRTMTGPNEHPPASFPDDECGLGVDAAENEARWDALYRENRRRQQRMQRITEERMAKGADPGEALEAAIDELVGPIFEENGDAENDAHADEMDFDDTQPWEDDSGESELDDLTESERDPLQQQATDLLMSFYDIADRTDGHPTTVEMLMRGMGDVCGGFAQVLPLPATYEMDDTQQGLSLAQLKRALRGAAFAQGALFLLNNDKTIDQNDFDRFSKFLESIRSDTVDLLRIVRQTDN